MILFLCGDVMTGRGIDQILPHPSPPRIYEPLVRDARMYVALAEDVNGPVPRSVEPSYIWGDALDELTHVAPAARIVNLETSVTRSEDARPKGINYRMHPANVACLIVAGLDVCVLANNHVLDYGPVGLLETLETLDRAGLTRTGAGRTLAEARRPAVVDLGDDRRVVVHGTGTETSGIPPSWAAMEHLAGVDLLSDLSDETAAAVADRVGRSKRSGDITVASIHWGGNWGYEVPPAHVRFARRLIDGGVDVVHGHSSHHARPIEVYRNRLILYGCGDFINDYEGISGHEEYRADLRLMYFPAFDAASGELRELRMTPMRLRKLRLNRVTPEEAMWLRDRLARINLESRSQIEASDDGRLSLSWR